MIAAAGTVSFLQGKRSGFDMNANPGLLLEDIKKACDFSFRTLRTAVKEDHYFHCSLFILGQFSDYASKIQLSRQLFF
ncbi:hypothetical protein PO81_10755 [Vibrio parahaemolyticus]|nr:hypothetical protein PO81_10755 [Vibrio parahaemolyticus]